MGPLRDKTLIMVVGPAGIGKSTIMHTVVKRDSRFSYVHSFTTRLKRDGEQSTYTHISDKEATDYEQSGSTITHFKHPTTGYVYGTTAKSYATQFNLLDTLSGAVEKYQSLPFQRTFTFSITTNPDSWEKWFLSRYPHPTEERSKRLKEALQSIRWSLDQTDGHYWLMNEPARPEAAALKIISVIDNDTRATLPPPQAAVLYERAKLLLSYQ